MGRLVRLQRGIWVKTDYGKWDFRSNPSDLGFEASVRDDEGFNSLMGIVSRRYLLEPTTPVSLTYRLPRLVSDPTMNSDQPSNILTDEDIRPFMAIRFSYPELTMCVTVGAEAVATFQFQCRRIFNVGGSSYLPEQEQPEKNLCISAEDNELITGRNIVGAQSVLEEIFTEEEMLVMHRVHLEMVYSNPIENVSGAFVSDESRTRNEIIVIDGDEDTEMGVARVDGTSIRPPTNGAPPIGTDGAYQDGILLTQRPSNQEMHEFGDAGMNLLDSYMQTNECHNYGGVDDAMDFWECLLAEGNAAVESTFVAGMLCGEDNAVNDGAPPCMVVNNTTLLASEESGDYSSTGSSSEVCVMADFESEHDLAIIESPTHAPTFLPPSVEVEMTEAERVTEGTRVTSTGPVSDGTAYAPVTEGNRVIVAGPVSDAPTVAPATTPATNVNGPESDGLFLGLTLSCGPVTDKAARVGDESINRSLSDESNSVGTHINNPHDIYVGMIFANRSAFKHHMALYAVHHKFQFRSSRSRPELMVLKCWGLSCPWRIYAARLEGSGLYEIRSALLIHNCTVDERGGYQRQATSTVIGGLMRTKYGGPGSGPRPNEIRAMMRGDHGVRISYWKAWRSRELAMNSAKGSSEQSYNSLPQYLQKLVVSNSGTLVELETAHDEGVGQRFKYMFFVLGASIKGYAYMRKVVVVDGTHLKGKYAGCLLTALAQDGNYQIFPLAFAIVDSENDRAWEWFFRKLYMFVPNEEDVVFISDRHASIYAGLNKVYPSARHCACVAHLKRNIKTYFRGRHLGHLVSMAARAYRLADFYRIFNEIKDMDPACAEYLIGIGFEHWARAHFNGLRYDIMTTNVAESWNAVVSLVEYIRSKIMSWFATRRESSKDLTEPLTPKVLEIVAGNFEISADYDVRAINSIEFEVRTNNGVSFHVDLGKKTCSCCEFQMLLIPCPHAVAAAVFTKVRVDSLVGKDYTTYNWMKTYASAINPVTELDSVPDLASTISELTLYPPTTRRPPGRPRKKRFFSRGETHARSLRRRTVCSRCKRLGHNRATCKMPI